MGTRSKGGYHSKGDWTPEQRLTWKRNKVLVLKGRHRRFRKRRRCQVGCRTMPGYLGIGDFERIANHLNVEDKRQFLLENFSLSEGAKARTSNGIVISVPTITPKQEDNGSCVFYKDNRCSIHEVSPFGCAFVDSHMPQEECNQRSKKAIVEILVERSDRGEYFQHQRILAEAGKTATPLKLRWKSYHEELERVEKRIAYEHGS